MRDTSWLPSYPPSSELWQQRRKDYDYLWSIAIHPDGSSNCQHAGSLKLELERCYCAGAWVACIIIAEAICEIHFSAEKKSNGINKNIFSEKLGILEDLKWLRDRRNALIHDKKQGMSLSNKDYRRERNSLENDAKRATLLALKVTLNNPSEDL
ncbi:hypothetical protein LG325_09315 [Marinobacter nauticus]